ncbi:MAG: hypothetical protein GY856_37925 [bacterium]|nr:hypothetical protein [bacterium]
MSKKARSEGEPKADARKAPPEPIANPWLAAALAWLVPGGGHFFLGRWGRASIFLVLVLLSLAIGCHLEGKLPLVLGGSLLATLGTLGCMGSGVAYVVLRFGLGYEGNFEAAGFEYGSAFILTAGLMNLLLVLDAWDIARGLKE